MKTDIVSYYRKHDASSRYMAGNEARVRQLSRLYKENKRYFGRRVLDLACGGGVLGFVLEPHGHRYTGVDVNPDMIAAANKHVREVGSKNRFILDDVLRMSVSGRFETVCMMGNALCHFSTGDFSQILNRVERRVRPGGNFVVDYRDLVLAMFNRRWNASKKLVQRGRVSATKGCDTRAGFVHVATNDLHGRQRVAFAHAIWSPFIMETIMKAQGWSLRKRSFSKRWYGWLDVYKKT